MNAVESAITSLIDGGLARIATSMENAGLSGLAMAERRAAPRGKTKETSRSIGKRLTLKARGGIVAGVAGINVAKTATRKMNGNEPHAHLVGMGTVHRYRKRLGGKFAFIRRPTNSQLSTGVMPANQFIAAAVIAARPGILERMANRGQKALDREAARINKRNRSN